MRRFTYLVIAGSAIIIFGTSSASAQVINGCISKNGTLKVVTDPSDCTSRETPISWNQAGPQGEPGEPGMDGAPGPEGPPGPTLRVFDALGAEIGWLAEWNSGPEIGTYRVFVESVGATIRLDLDGTLNIADSSQTFFSELDCVGQAYVERKYVGRVTGVGERLFIGRREPSFDPEYLSRLPNPNNCSNDQDSGPLVNAVSADEITLEDIGLTFPLPAPLYVGLPPG